MSRSSDSYLKSLPPSGPYQRRIARYRMKGYHAETVPGDGNELDASAVYPLFPPWWPGIPTWARDATADDSDKSFTIPAGKVWCLEQVYIILASTATVGNRQLLITISDGTNVISQYGPLQNQAASTTYRYLFGLYARAAVDGFGNGYVPFQGVILPSGYVVRVYDSAAIDAAADDLTVVLHYVEYDAP